MDPCDAKYPGLFHLHTCGLHPGHLGHCRCAYSFCYAGTTVRTTSGQITTPTIVRGSVEGSRAVLDEADLARRERALLAGRARAAEATRALRRLWREA